MSGEFDDKNVYSQLKDFCRKVDQDHTTHSNYLLLPGHCRQFLWPNRGAIGRQWADGREQSALAPGHHRKAFWARPRFGQDPEHAIAEGCQRKTDLSHRSLSGQGNCAEYFGLPIRQRNLRAHLEPPLYRSRADLGGGNGGRGSSAAVITIRPARCATWCPTTSCNSSA